MRCNYESQTPQQQNASFWNPTSPPIDVNHIPSLSESDYFSQSTCSVNESTIDKQDSSKSHSHLNARKTRSSLSPVTVPYIIKDTSTQKDSLAEESSSISQPPSSSHKNKKRTAAKIPVKRSASCDSPRRNKMLTNDLSSGAASLKRNTGNNQSLWKLKRSKSFKLIRNKSNCK